MVSFGSCTAGAREDGEPQRSAAAGRRAVLLVHFGTPDSSDVSSVRRFATEMFCDPEVIRLPRGLRWLRPLVGRLAGSFTAARLAENYRGTWTGDGPPALVIACEQAAALESKLPAGRPVFLAMRYGQPGIAETVERLVTLGVDELVVVSMCPDHSGTTTQAVLREVCRQIARTGSPIDVTTRNLWLDDIGYVNAQARLIRDHAAARGLTPRDTHLVFSLRSLPISRTARREAYVDQARQAALLVAHRLGWPAQRVSQGFHDHPGSVKCLQPATADILAELSRGGEERVLLCPLDFTIEGPETLARAQAKYRAQFEQAGGRFFTCPGLNASPPFIAALKNLVLHGRRPAAAHQSGGGLEAAPLVHATPADSASARIDSLVMVGLSLGGPLGSGLGPNLPHTNTDELRSIKRPRCEVSDALRALCSAGLLREALLWNTCRRVEFYGWQNGATDAAARADITASVRRRLFGQSGGGDAVQPNVLHGVDAWHHLMRTAAGLNSGLPGEREVMQQLQAAYRLAERAGTAGPLTKALLDEVSRQERQLREETTWGAFDPHYSYAALSHIVRSAKLDLAACQCVVIGGSTTSCGVLDVLTGRFDVPSRQLTLLYRGHGQGGRLKMLRRAIGNGRRIRVDKYGEKAVVQAIADADLVVFGLDRREPVFSERQIRELRDFNARPLAILDFNLFGSTGEMESRDGVRLWKAEDLECAVTAFADNLCAGPPFTRAVAAAESWIRDHVPARLNVSRTNGKYRRHVRQRPCPPARSLDLGATREA